MNSGLENSVERTGRDPVSAAQELGRGSLDSSTKLQSQPAVSNATVDSMKVYDAVDSFMNLGDPNRIDHYFNLSEEEKEAFVKTLAKLIKRGFVGYEVLHVNGSKTPQKVDVVMQIGSKVNYYNSPLKQAYNP